MTLTIDKIKAAIERVPNTGLVAQLGPRPGEFEFARNFGGKTCWFYLTITPSAIRVSLSPQTRFPNGYDPRTLSWLIAETVRLVRAELDKEMSNGNDR